MRSCRYLLCDRMLSSCDRNGPIRATVQEVRRMVVIRSAIVIKCQEETCGVSHRESPPARIASRPTRREGCRRATAELKATSNPTGLGQSRSRACVAKGP